MNHELRSDERARDTSCELLGLFTVGFSSLEYNSQGEKKNANWRTYNDQEFPNEDTESR
jgi:hypothetical protein